jgi:NAD(P)-dependent dehydrogenase (short-subunit alcohol dehydrogenase family)
MLGSMELHDKTALVTGGAIRIGAAISEALAARGCRVLIHYHTSAAEAADLAQRLGESPGGPCLAIGGDLATEDGCRRVVDDAWQEAGRADILVNNAAVFHRDSLQASSEEKMMAELRMNLLAPMFLIREFAARAGEGKIVNLLDSRIAGTGQGCVPYFLAKQALAELTRSAALELAPTITVNGVAPGPVLPPPPTSGGASAEKAGALPLERRPLPQDVADAVVFLLENDAITGQVIFVDSGQHLVMNH